MMAGLWGLLFGSIAIAFGLFLLTQSYRKVMRWPRIPPESRFVSLVRVRVIKQMGSGITLIIIGVYLMVRYFNSP